MSSEEMAKMVELARLADHIEADLLAAFLEDGGLEFQMRRSARTMATIMPSSEVAVRFFVYEDNLEQARELLEEYNREQGQSSVPSEFPESVDDPNDPQPETVDDVKDE